MHVVSVCPFRVGSLVFRPTPERWARTIVVKGTFSLAPGQSGQSSLAPEQDDLNERENHWDDDPGRSVYAPVDLVPFKRRADVLLVGNAFAPQSEPARSLIARLCVGALDKSIEVYCPRVWTRDGQIREGARWTRMALRYERAAGGPGTWNPVGVSPQGPTDTFGQRPLPNLQPPGLTLASPGDVVAPVGFGPIASGWALRRDKLRGRAATWTEASLPDTPLDGDFDPLYFQAAPPDQQVDAIHEEERIVLENLHPEHSRLSTRLPGMHPRAFVDLGSGAQDVAMVADTLWIDTDRSIVTVTWRGHVPLGRPDQPGRVVVALEGVGQRLTWASVSALAGTGGQDSATLAPRPADPLPAGPVAAGSPGGGPPAAPKFGASPRARGPGSAVRTAFPIQEPTREPLPFARHEDPSRPVAASIPNPPSVRAVGTGTRPNFVVPEDIATTAPAWLAAPGPAAAASDPGPPAPVAPFHAVAVGPAPNPEPLRGPVPPPMASAYVADRQPLFSSSGSGEASVPAPAAPPLDARAAPPPPERVSLGDVNERGLSAASFVSAAAASNAAAPPPARRKASASASREAEQIPLELIWFDPSFLARIRKSPAFLPLLQKAPRRPPPRSVPPPPPDPPDAAEEATLADLASVLSRGTPLSAAELDDAAAQALVSGTLTPPLVLVDGELDFPFDEIEMLKATMGAASPLAAGDKKLKDLLDFAGEMLKTELRGAPDVVDNLVLRVREAWSKANRLLPPHQIEAHPERLLLEQRRYQKRELLDGAWIRALFSLGGSEAPVPTYLPVSLAGRLPLFKRFSARAIVEALPQQDQYESHPLALRVAALARVVTQRPRAASRH